MQGKFIWLIVDAVIGLLIVIVIVDICYAARPLPSRISVVLLPRTPNDLSIGVLCGRPQAQGEKKPRGDLYRGRDEDCRARLQWDGSRQYWSGQFVIDKTNERIRFRCDRSFEGVWLAMDGKSNVEVQAQ